MKTFCLLLSILAFSLFSSFATSDACNYAGSNFGFVKTQTEKALANNNLNKSKFFTYKAIKTIQATTGKLDDCGCADAAVNIKESLSNLRAATRATSLNGSRILLQEALQHTIDALKSLSQHETHDTMISSKEYVMNTSVEFQKKVTTSNFEKIELHKKIDTSLLKYEASLNSAVDSLKCSDAKAFADRIFEHCEQELLKNNLSEAKKYYNFKTKEITAKALERMGNCSSSATK